LRYTDAQDLIRAHYESEDAFHSVVDRIINTEMQAGKEISANRIRSTFNHYSDKKRDGYTVKPLHELSALNKEKSNMVEIRQSDIDLNDVITSPEVITTIKDVITEFRNRDKLDKYGLEVLNKVMLSGPPGVGKTWTAMAIAGELNLDLVFVRWDSLISSYLGTTGANIRKVFELAHESPVVLFLDEFDSVGKERGGTDHEVGEMSRVVINLLQNVDMFPPESFLVAATNHEHLLDSAIWRRFTTIKVKLPVPEERQRLIYYYKKDLPVDIHVGDWVKNTEGLSGAEIRTRLHKEAKKQILGPLVEDTKLQLV
jgi:AAA+ superfamily predicted ATPase